MQIRYMAQTRLCRRSTRGEHLSFFKLRLCTSLMQRTKDIFNIFRMELALTDSFACTLALATTSTQETSANKIELLIQSQILYTLVWK